MPGSRIVEFLVLLAVSWVVMTFTHETGHLVGGWLGGATLVECDLAPWRMPYCLHDPDPNPLLTLWSGPVLGMVVPVAVAAVVRARRVWFVADFCLLANGLYLAASWYSGDAYLDTPRLFAEGASPVAVGAYCLVTIGVGYVRFRRDCIEVLNGPVEASQ